MPLARDFFRAFSSLPTGNTLHARVGDIQHYTWLSRGVSPDKFGEIRDDIETFMTNLEAEIDKHLQLTQREGRASRLAIAAARAATNMHFVIANVVNEAQSGPNSSVYDDLIRHCGPDDVFVTLNWDTLLDRSLAASGCWEPGRGYGLTFDAVYASRWLRRFPLDGHVYGCNWRLYKLHGSTNWLTPHYGISPTTLEAEYVVAGTNKAFLYWEGSLPFNTYASRWSGGYASTCYGYYPPNLPARYFDAASMTAREGMVFVRARPNTFDAKSPPPDSGIPASPLLITPVRQKRYAGYSRAIDEMWRAARSRLREVDRIVVAGYSFPPTDVAVRELILEAFRSAPHRKDLVIVDIDPKAVLARLSPYELSACRRISTFAGTMDRFVKCLASRGAARMRLLMRSDREIRDWVLRLDAMDRVGRTRYRSRSAGTDNDATLDT